MILFRSQGKYTLRIYLLKRKRDKFHKKKLKKINHCNLLGYFKSFIEFHVMIICDKEIKNKIITVL